MVQPSLFILSFTSMVRVTLPLLLLSALVLSSPACSFSLERQRISALSAPPSSLAARSSNQQFFHNNINNNNRSVRLMPMAGIQNVLSVPRSGASSSTELNSHAMKALDTFWKNQNPFVTAAVVCAIKAFSADLFAQKRTQALSETDSKRFTFDKRRSLSFVLYGAAYQGVCQEFIYNNLYSFLFGNGTTFLVVAKKVIFDAIFHNLLVCVPMSYVIKSLVFGTGVKVGIQQYIDDVLHKGLMIKYYSIWMPTNALIFTIPKHWRITVMAMVSFFWMTILSTISTRKRVEEK
jgi:hypothetical protein